MEYLSPPESEATLTGTEREQLEAFLADNRRELAGRTRAELGLPENAHDSWVLTDDDTIDSVLAAYRTAWSESDEIAAGLDLDDLAVHNRRGPLTLRWIYVHMIQELARHAGHGDILKEQILAADQFRAAP